MKGVNELPTKPERVVGALGKLIEYAKVVIPEKLHSRTPIFILATAGLRITAEVNKEKIFNDRGEFLGGNTLNPINVDVFKPNKDNMARVSSIIQYIRSYFSKKSPFLLVDQAACRVASGSEEGIYSYVSLQHLLSRAGRNASFGLTDKQPVFFPTMARFQSYFRSPISSNFPVHFDTTKIQTHRTEPPTEVIENPLDIGTIDMGGGSVQITFHTASQTTASHSLMLPSQPDNSVPVFTHSFLGYGMYAVLDRFWWATILRHLDANKITLISTPDLSSVDIRAVSPLFQVPSAKVLADHARYVAKNNITILNPCMVKGAEDTVDLRDYGFPMVGTGRFEECKAMILELFDFSTKCVDDKDSVCAFGGVKIPKIGPKTFFFASDHARRIADYMRLDGYMSLSELHNHVNVLCESDARTAISPIFRRTTSNWTHQICFAGTYTFALLHHGSLSLSFFFSLITDLLCGCRFKIPLDSPRIAFEDYIDGEELNWGIGAFMQELTGSCIRSDRLF